MFDVHIWIDAESDFDTHIYVKRSNDAKVLHYYHWDSMLLWQLEDMLQAERVFVH